MQDEMSRKKENLSLIFLERRYCAHETRLGCYKKYNKKKIFKGYKFF